MAENVETLTLETLKAAVTGSAAAFRCRRRLQPAGGPGDKVFPPTFAGAVYAVEKRRLPERAEPVTCVLLDSVQSQANRMELALQEAYDSKRLTLPILEVDFTPWGPTGDVEDDKAKGRLVDAVGKISSLQAPHRLADAILRDSEIEENNGNKTDTVPFRQSIRGRALNTVSSLNATALYRLCPTALILGMWDSTGPKGGLGAKFERALVSEVVGIGTVEGDLLRGVRRDPLEIRAAVGVVKAGDASWSLADPGVKGAVPPSKINHSSVPFPKQRLQKTDDNNYSGVTLDYAEQITTLSLIALRRLRFPMFPIQDERLPKVESAGHAVLAALGLCAATLASENGLGLRSRCLLWPEGPMTWELLAKPGESPRVFSLTGDQAIKLLNEAVEEAADVGLQWEKDPIQLKPQGKLVELVRRSQIEATKESKED